MGSHFRSEPSIGLWLSKWKWCNGINDCNYYCNWVQNAYSGTNITVHECANDEDPIRCSICPKNYGYPYRDSKWSATHLCYHNETRRPICGIPCNGRNDCHGNYTQTPVRLVSNKKSELHFSLNAFQMDLMKKTANHWPLK